jgi:hypothetical protein
LRAAGPSTLTFRDFVNPEDGAPALASKPAEGMRVSKEERIAGYPAVWLRDVLRVLGPQSPFYVETVAFRAGMIRDESGVVGDVGEGVELLDALLVAGLVEKYDADASWMSGGPLALLAGVSEEHAVWPDHNGPGCRARKGL